MTSNHKKHILGGDQQKEEVSSSPALAHTRSDVQDGPQGHTKDMDLEHIWTWPKLCLGQLWKVKPGHLFKSSRKQGFGGVTKVSNPF